MTHNQFLVLFQLIKIGFAGLHTSKEGMMIFNGVADELYRQYNNAEAQKVVDAVNARPNPSNDPPADVPQ